MVCAARLSQILVKRGTNGVLTLKAPGAALFYTAGPCGWRRMSSQSQSSRGDRVGPDRILPANSLSTTWPDGAVEIRFSDKHPLCQEKPISVSDLTLRSLQPNFQKTWAPTFIRRLEFGMLSLQSVSQKSSCQVEKLNFLLRYI